MNHSRDQAAAAQPTLFDDPLLQSLHTAVQALQAQLHGHAHGRQAAVTVAYSTGVDSTALLHASSRLREHGLLELRALHINHGLQQDCDHWQALAEQQCQRLEVPLKVVRVQVNQRGASMETAARAARYRAFSAHMQAGEILLLAHHQGDQAETVLLHLLRGSGARGLSGMPRSRPLARSGAWLLRPWLHQPAERLRAYCTQHTLTYSADSSNADPRHDRGWLRTQLLPLLAQRKPTAIANIAFSARLLAHNRKLATAQLDHLLSAMLDGDQSGGSLGSLDGDALIRLDDRLLQHDLIRHWLQSMRLQPPARRQLDTLIKQLSIAGKDKHPALIQPHYTLVRHQRRLHVQLGSGPPLPPAQWQLPTPWRHAQFGTLCLRPEPNHGDVASLTTNLARWPTLTVTGRLGGERIKLADGHRHRVKKVLQQAGVPPWQRSRLPLIWHRQRLLAVADLCLHPALLRWLQQHRLQLRWQPAKLADVESDSAAAMVTQPPR